jgi:hypothetical protein
MRPKRFPPFLALVAVMLLPTAVLAEPPPVSGNAVLFNVTGKVLASNGVLAPELASPGNGLLAPAKLRITVVDVYLGPGGAQSPSGTHTIDVPIPVGHNPSNTIQDVRDSLVASLSQTYSLQICAGGHRLKITNANSFSFSDSIVGVIVGQAYTNYPVNVCPAPMMGDPLLLVMGALLLGIATVRLRLRPASVEVVTLRG